MDGSYLNIFNDLSLLENINTSKGSEKDFPTTSGMISFLFI